MAAWMKILLVVLSLCIGGGVAAVLYDLHPMRPYYSSMNEGCPADSGPGSEQRIDCYDRYRRIMDEADGQDRWVAIGAGIGAILLFWLLLNLLYIRPRRRRAEQSASI